MTTITLFKKYADGNVKGLEVNKTEENVKTLLGHGFFLTEKEAEAGKFLEEKEPEPKPEPAKTAPKKPAAKKGVAAVVKKA